MPRVILEGTAGRILASVSQTVEVCDESGRVLGRFTPALDTAKRRPTEPQVSDEELRRRARAGGGRALAEILSDMEKRRFE